MNSRSLEWVVDVLSELDAKQKCVFQWRRCVYIDDGTIGTSRGKAHYKSPFLMHQLSLFT
jgi:hypothetical protein